jgi:putative flippase GtrA
VTVTAERDKALRAGLIYFHRELEWLPGVIAAEPDEGYTADDILKVACAMQESPGKFVIASREVRRGLDLRARLIRACAGKFLYALHGRAVRDPWAGLKGMPSAIVPALLDLKGEGRTFAFNIVLNLQHKGVKAASMPVSAPYAPGEGRERGARVKDVFRILALPFTFISASLAATAADYAVFLTLDTLLIPGHWAVSITAGRATGAVVGYFLNRSLVFRRKNNTWRKELVAAAQFASLALFNYGASLGLVYVLHDLLHINEIIARFFADVLLFATSYMFQREVIFRRKAPAAK